MMEPRSLNLRSPVAESSASALDTRSQTQGIRHRGLSPRIPQDENTVLAGPRAQSPSLPLDAEHATSKPGQQFLEIRESTSFSETVLEAIPLTPRPELLSGPVKSESDDGVKSIGTGRMSFSRASRLPSPAFSAAPRLEARSEPGFASRTSYAGIFDFFKRPTDGVKPKMKRTNSLGYGTRSFVNRAGEYAARLQDATASSWRNLRTSSLDRLRIPSLRLSGVDSTASQLLQSRTRTNSTSRSSRTTSSTRTCASASSVDSGRTYLFPGVNTTDKFTHRWPVPGSMNKLRRGSTARPTDDFQSVSSEEFVSGTFDVGLGFQGIGRWRTHKWILFLSVVSLLGYSIAALGFVIRTWYQTWDHADVMLVADGDVLILTTLCASLLLLAALVGLTGTLLNSRPLLAIYALLLWPAFISLLSVGYVSYKRVTFSLDRKLNMAWSKWYTDSGRAVIQDSLRCCGFTDPTHEAVYGPGFAGGCYARTLRPGCKGPLLRFERENLNALWRAAFSAVPLHIISIIICLLCANHVTRTFGTGLLPRAYRLRLNDVRTDAKGLLEHFASSENDLNPKDDDGELGFNSAMRATRLPPLMAHTESGFGVRREDKAYSYRYRDDEDDYWRRV